MQMQIERWIKTKYCTVISPCSGEAEKQRKIAKGRSHYVALAAHALAIGFFIIVIIITLLKADVIGDDDDEMTKAGRLHSGRLAGVLANCYKLVVSRGKQKG